MSDESTDTLPEAAEEVKPEESIESLRREIKSLTAQLKKATETIENMEGKRGSLDIPYCVVRVNRVEKYYTGFVKGELGGKMPIPSYVDDDSAMLIGYIDGQRKRLTAPTAPVTAYAERATPADHAAMDAEIRDDK